MRGRAIFSTSKGGSKPPASLLSKVNKLVELYGTCMFEQKAKKVYLLLDHYRYMDWRKQSARAFVSDGEFPKGLHSQDDGKFFYIHSPIIVKQLKNNKYG